MNEVLKSKHVLGGLVLSDIVELVKNFSSVTVDGQLYEAFTFSPNTLEIYHQSEDEYSEMSLELSTPVKVKGGSVVVMDNEEIVLVFGRVDFIPGNIEIV